MEGDADPSFNVLGHDEVMTVLRDHESYSSQLLTEIMGPVLDHTMIAMDEPEHRAQRALVAPAFRPKLLARWEHELVRRVVDELIDSFALSGRADLVRRLTFAFPVRVIARILGVSPATVTQTTKELLARRLITELDSVPSAGGRPARLLGLDGAAGYAIGAKVTADHIAIVSVGLDGTARRTALPPIVNGSSVSMG